MKVTNWRRKMMAAIIAGGTLAPCAAHAVNIPLADASFEDYSLPSSPAVNGFAYADSYRPTSEWVDDLDSPSLPLSNNYLEDEGDSNWLYNSAYAELPGSTNHYRPSPRTLNQAMHGLHNYNAQELTTQFAAEKIYTFSVYAQGDADAIASDNRVWLYLFNGSVPFKESTALKTEEFQGGPGGDFPKRGLSMTPTESKNNWQKISISHIVYPGAAEVNQPIGVGFYIQRDAAIDDAALEVVDASTQLLVLEVQTTDGQMRIVNQTGSPMNIDYYDIRSAHSSLNATTWHSLQEQNAPGFPAGNGSGNGWEQAGGSNAKAIGESYLTGNSVISSTPVGLGAGFNVGGWQDLIFRYGKTVPTGANPEGDYTNDGIVDAADYVLWRAGTTAGVYNTWQANFGDDGVYGPSTKIRGLVRYVTTFPGGGGSSVPEPTSVALIGLGLAGLLMIGRYRKESEDKQSA